MHHLAAAVVDAAAMFELSSDDAIDPRTAVQGLEDIAAALANATSAEVEALRSVAAIRESAATSEVARTFFRDFLYNIGLENDAP